MAARSFPQNEEVALFAEIYDNSGGTAHKVDITTTVTTDEGKVLFKVDEERDSADLGGKRGDEPHQDRNRGGGLERPEGHGCGRHHGDLGVGEAIVAPHLLPQQAVAIGGLPSEVL